MKYKFLLIMIGGVLMGCSVPKAAFKASVETDTVPAVVAFENDSENAETYVWEFGDGDTSSVKNPSHRYLRSGVYPVTLKAIKGKKEDITQMNIEMKAPDGCLVEMSTPYGAMLIKLYDETPEHRDNFLKLAEQGYYDGLLFHRVINGFMIQGGDPNSKDAGSGAMLGTGGPGYKVPAEFNENLVHVKGALAAARQGDAVNPEKASSGSQFYIVQGTPVQQEMLELIEIRNGISYTPEQREQYVEKGGTPQLDMQYTVFGKVIEGLDVIDKIAGVDTDGRDRPVDDVKMEMKVIK